MAIKNIDGDVKVEFTEPAQRQTLDSGESAKTLFGKISKWLRDLKAVAFTGSYNDLTDKPTIPSSAVTGVKGDNESSYRDGNVNITKSNIGLGNVQNKSSATIRSEITSTNVTNALGYTPLNKAGDTMTGDLLVDASSESPWVINVDGEWPYIKFEDASIVLEAGKTVGEELQGIATLEAVLMDDGYPYISIGVADFRGSETVQHYILVGASGITIDGQTLKTVALTGSYNDLTNKPTIPTTYVSGVKGNSESSYRSGQVNITAANIGAVRYDTSSQGLTSTQKSNARTNLGLGSAATYSSSSFATSTQGGYATDFNSNFKPIFTTSGQSHASVFRGKYLGSSFTSAQKTAIANGTFDDLFVGDYWTINSINWRIADINYFKKTTFTTNHLVIMPDTSLYLARMNSSNTTTGGYANSEMWTTNLATALTTIQNAFGSSYIAQFVGTFNNAVSNGIASGYAKTTVQCAIPTASMIWGSSAKYSNYSDFNSGTGKAQLSLFAHNKALIPSQDGYNYWLSDVASANAFNLCNGNAVMDAAGASLATAVYVRPYFCLKGA